MRISLIILFLMAQSLAWARVEISYSEKTELFLKLSPASQQLYFVGLSEGASLTLHDTFLNDATTIKKIDACAENSFEFWADEFSSHLRERPLHWNMPLSVNYISFVLTYCGIGDGDQMVERLPGYLN